MAFQTFFRPNLRRAYAPAFSAKASSQCIEKLFGIGHACNLVIIESKSKDNTNAVNASLGLIASSTGTLHQKHESNITHFAIVK